MNEETYKIALSKAKKTESALQMKDPNESDSEYSNCMSHEMFQRLRASVDSTFSDLKIFQKGGPLHESLLNVLMAYLYYRQDVGWLEGTNYCAAVLLLNLPADKSFIALANLLNRPLPLAIYTRDEPALNRFIAAFLPIFARSLPDLYKHSKLI